MKKILFLLFILAATRTNACLNYFYTIDAKGNFHPEDDVRRGFNTNFNKKKIVLKLGEIEKKLKKEHSYAHLSDYAILLMKLGKVKESVKILSVLSYNYPEDYRIASNLGTAYELTGEIDSAMKYIQRGLELNPGDHEGSEWIHVKVLETKMKLKKDAKWLEKNTVLGLTEEQEKDPDIAWQINIQVRERFPFTPGPDPIMASLLIDLSDCYANTSSLEFSKAVLEIARDYYGASEMQVNDKLNDIQHLLNQYIGRHPERVDENDHAEHNRVGNISAKSLLDDNDKENFHVQWEKINTNVDSLLGYADLTMPPVIIPEEKTDSVPAPESHKGGEEQLIPEEEKEGFPYLYIGVGSSLLAFIYFRMRSKKKG